MEDTAPYLPFRAEGAASIDDDLDTRVHALARRVTLLEREVAELSSEQVRASRPAERPRSFWMWKCSDLDTYLIERHG